MEVTYFPFYLLQQLFVSFFERGMLVLARTLLFLLSEAQLTLHNFMKVI